MNFYHKMVLHLLFIETIYYLITQKKFLYPHLHIFMRFSDSNNLDIPKPTRYANRDSSPFICDTSSSDDKTIYPPNQDTSLNDTSSYGTFIIKTHDTNPSSSDTFPSAPNLTSSAFQTVLTPQPRSVTIPPTRPISNTFDTSSTINSSTSSTSNQPPVSEIPMTPSTQSQPSLIHTPLVHIPNPESVARYINY